MPTAIQHVVLIVHLRFSSGNVICRAVLDRFGISPYGVQYRRVRTVMQLEEQRQSISPMLWNRKARRFQNSTGILKVNRLDSAKVCPVRFVASGGFSSSTFKSAVFACFACFSVRSPACADFLIQCSRIPGPGYKFPVCVAGVGLG